MSQEVYEVAVLVLLGGAGVLWLVAWAFGAWLDYQDRKHQAQNTTVVNLFTDWGEHIGQVEVPYQVYPNRYLSVHGQDYLVTQVIDNQAYAYQEVTTAESEAF